LSDKKSQLAVVRQFQSETDTIREAPEPRYARITVLVLTGLIVSCVAVMSLTRMDRVVTSITGKIIPEHLLNVYQALDPSIIRTINVHEGQEVERGQPLASLDPTFAAADVHQTRLQIIALEAQVARDEAQLSDRTLLSPDSSDPDVRKYAAINKSYYDQQVAQYKAQLDSFDAKIKQTQATVQKYQTDEAAYQRRSEIAQKIEEMRSTSAEHGSGSQLNLMIARDQHVDLVRNLDYDHNSLIEAQHMLASLNADRQSFIQQWNTNLSQDLVTARGTLDTAKAQLEKAMRHQDLVQWSAAERSIVLTVAKLSVGSVLKEGDTLFTLMPVDTPLEAEARVASREVGFVRTGDRCTLKVDAFNYMEHGTAEGAVRWISDGAFSTDDDTGQPVDPFYKVRCSIDALHFQNVGPNFRLIPGMTLTADLKVGTRSVLMYILSGAMRGLDESMREP
jgi:HlyD family secretion protein